MGSGLGGTIIVDDTGENRLERMDDLDCTLPVRYIKLDIEGSEKNALKGGVNRIKKDRLFMAICAYHLQDDLLELYKLISTIGDYKFYLRHYMV